ncbi:ABC transporter substrate-binding protein [Paenibacillus sp. 1P07SE]|uniref:ABC transporter substrate-binding protein n=1 Tax=Paenibacillus sp. 1P07SE TaxID=3132209 RepID=UPI0039A4A08B
MATTRNLASKKWNLALAVMLILSIVIAGCSSGPESADNNPPAAPNGGGEETNATAEDPLEPVKLRWYLRQAEPNNAQSVLARFNEMVEAKINATVEFIFVNPADYDSKMQLAMSSGEAYDLAFTSAWSNNYQNNVSKGAYVALDEYLEKLPNLKGMFRSEIWDAVRMDGQIYGIPNKQIMNNQQGYWFQKALLDKHQLDVSGIAKLEDLEPVLQTIKDNEPEVYPAREGIFYTFTEFNPLVVQFHNSDGVRVDAETLKVIDDSELLLERFKLLRDWNQKGFFPPDVATLKNQNELIQAGKIFSMYSRQKPGNEAEIQKNFGIDVEVIAAGEPVIQQSSVQSSLTAVSTSSDNPERALMLLDLLNSDKEIYNTLVFGLEGQDYTKVSDERIEPIAGGYYVTNWMVGNVFNSYLIPGQADDVWQATEQMDEEAIIDPLIGFVFDRTPVQNEIARCIATSKEFIPILQNGLDDAEKVFAEYQQKMKASGIELVKEEVERQLAEWKATQG